MDIDIENDPYFIPTVPRYKKNLFSDDLDETIGDRFFELNFGDSLCSPRIESKTLPPKPVRMSTGPVLLATKKENIPLRPSVPQSTMRLRSTASKNLDFASESMSVAQRTRRSRSLIKPGRPSIETKRAPIVSETSKPLPSSVTGIVKVGSIFSTKPKESLQLNSVNGQSEIKSRRSRSLIKPSRPSVGSVNVAPIQKTSYFEKSTVHKVLPVAQKVSPVGAKVSMVPTTTTPKHKSTYISSIHKPLLTTTTISRFASKPKEALTLIQTSAYTPSKRRSSYMAPTISSAQRGQGSTLRKQ